jgi:AcrR family transcriptional regulator
VDTTAPTRASARERLLAAADELFYEEGVHTVGIDRVIERAGVAKASLYSAFGSKDELIRVYLERRHEERKARVMRALETRTTPRERLLAVFDVLGDAIAAPTFRGCAFVSASAECERGSGIEQVSDSARAWTRSLFAELATEAGASDPDLLAQQLVLLYDGATVSARMDRDSTSARAARTVAEVLVDAAVDS